MDEKRNTERVKKSLKAEVHTKDGMTFSSLVDISPGGVFISTPEPLSQGEEVKMSIVAPESESVDIKGVIRWNRDEADETKAGMGIQFIDLSEQDKEKIESILQ